LSEKRDSYFEKLNRYTKDRQNLRQIVTSLSLVVILIVFWSLKLTGIGVAGEAFCGKAEHVHSQQCATPCPVEEHVHIASCYSNIKADVESKKDWDKALGNMANGPTTRENLVLVASSQMGYRESVLNFQVDTDGVRRGITRYGQWYGNPYGDWSAMFVSFCLNYAGAKNVPANAGPEAMRLEWNKAGLYEDAKSGKPQAGNLIFLRKGEGTSQTANAVAVITAVDETAITVIEGDVDNQVAQVQYSRDDAAILGYGLVPEANTIVVVDNPSGNGTNYTLWLDGTDGGLDHLTGSPNTAHTVENGSTIRLPAAWTTSSKYSYKLRGWYDVTNSCYYPAGGEMRISGNAVLYADWVASTYDIGVFNAQVANTVSTNSFITTHMFDYNYLFNIQSSNAQVTVSNRSHSETWSMVSSGAVKYGNAQTYNLIFAEADGGGRLSNPNNRSDRNRYHNADTISAGIYTPAMGELLFSTQNGFDPLTGTGVLGKTYLGTGDHLFQIMDDPSDAYYGYYYYDSLRNAISFNQSNERFYVYEYLSATSDALGNSYADFLPLNSPYANINGKYPGTYTYAGHHNEYAGVTHYRYDTDYSSGSNNTENNVHTEFAYGMRTDINFYLPNDPGSGGNKDLHGNDIEFQFSGDDDLWVLIDGHLVLDIGGIHQRIGGQINFSTGVVTVNGRTATSLMDLGITAGDHTLTVLYLERGGSMSNCSIYFNLVPRFGLEIQKEDVLTQQVLNGAQFTVYKDFACTTPAELWISEEAYNLDRADGVLDQFQSTFTVVDGKMPIWGFGSGVTYYIKETGPPTAEGYGLPDGVIQLTVEKAGLASYRVDVVADADGNQPSKGFTVHGVHIDEKTNMVYMVVTNAPESVVETTTVQVIKKWEDNADHSKDYIKAYLTVTDPDGTVRRIREITLSNENAWMYTWTNLPKHNYDTLTEVKYGVEESYESGYYSTVRKITQIQIDRTEWAEAASFVNGESYILKHSNGYLSTTSMLDAKLRWVDEATAQNSNLATWKATVSNGKVKFTNGAGQILTFYYSSWNSNDRYFYATTGSSSYQTFTPVDAGSGFRFYVTRSNRDYYLSSSGINSSGRIPSTTTSASGMILTPMKKITQTDIQQVEDWAYEITNTPLPADNETSMTVKKEWIVPEGYDEKLYQEFGVTVRLLANGTNTGRSVTLTLKNGWEGVFLGLPYRDEAGNVIQYTVEEVWEKDRWTTEYGQIQTTGSDPVEYSVTIVNTYHAGGPELPATGSAARLMYVLCGAGIMLCSLAYGIGSRRKRERRTN
jgi:fibro-slime domain-containing protein